MEKKICPVCGWQGFQRFCINKSHGYLKKVKYFDVPKEGFFI